MAPESTKIDGDKQKSLDQEVRELISALTSRLGSHKLGGSSSGANDDEEQGVRIITLAGTNLGASMRGDLDEKVPAPQQPEQEDSASYVVNSNFQAINNSIMLDGSYKTNDPGVHLDITDYVDPNEDHKKGKKGKKSKRESHHVETSEHHGSDTDDHTS